MQCWWWGWFGLGNWQQEWLAVNWLSKINTTTLSTMKLLIWYHHHWVSDIEAIDLLSFDQKLWYKMNEDTYGRLAVKKAGDDWVPQKYVQCETVETSKKKSVVFHKKNCSWMIVEMANDDVLVGIEKQQQVHLKLKLGDDDYPYRGWFTVYYVKGFDIILGMCWVCDMNGTYFIIILINDQMKCGQLRVTTQRMIVKTYCVCITSVACSRTANQTSKPSMKKPRLLALILSASNNSIPWIIDLHLAHSSFECCTISLSQCNCQTTFSRCYLTLRIVGYFLIQHTTPPGVHHNSRLTYHQKKIR